MKLVCDTNVFYNFVEGTRDPKALKENGTHQVCVSPVAFMEIASKLTTSNFAKRRDTAQAILDHADIYLKDTERHLADIWKFPIPSLVTDWKEGLKAIASAPDLEALEKGVPDFQDRVVRTVAVETAFEWREEHYDDFAQRFIGAIVSEVPKYQQGKGGPKYLRGDRADGFKKKFNDLGFVGAVLFATQMRVALHLEEMPVEEFKKLLPDAKTHDAAWIALDPYLKVYRQYIIESATERKPQPNDWGDLEYFIYLQDDRRLVTREKRWINSAKAAGIDKWLLDPEAK
jgi:predicted nucleic acid-binding protein